MGMNPCSNSCVYLGFNFFGHNLRCYSVEAYQFSECWGFRHSKIISPWSDFDPIFNIDPIHLLNGPLVGFCLISTNKEFLERLKISEYMYGSIYVIRCWCRCKALCTISLLVLTFGRSCKYVHEYFSTWRPMHNTILHTFIDLL